MAKHKSIYLFLALACFLGIILIFVFDGYMGVYDSLTVDNGQFRQTIDADQWQQQEQFGYYPTMSVDRNGSANLTYTVENHRFSAYAAGIRVSLYLGTEQIADLADGQVSAGAFGQGEFTWMLVPSQFTPAEYPPDQGYNLTMIIDRGNVERKIQVYINPGPPLPKPIITITPPSTR